MKNNCYFKKIMKETEVYVIQICICVLKIINVSNYATYLPHILKFSAPCKEWSNANPNWDVFYRVHRVLLRCNAVISRI